jgi:ABC-type lipoprotein release transport system permease subunit
MLQAAWLANYPNLTLAVEGDAAAVIAGVRQDPVTFAATGVLFFGLGAVAGILPATRASRVDPMVALRAE